MTTRPAPTTTRWGRPLAAAARFYARRPMAVGGGSHACDPGERELAHATLRADDAARLAEHVAERGDWREVATRTRDARDLAHVAVTLARR